MKTLTSILCTTSKTSETYCLQFTYPLLKPSLPTIGFTLGIQEEKHGGENIKSLAARFILLIAFLRAPLTRDVTKGMGIYTGNTTLLIEIRLDNERC